MLQDETDENVVEGLGTKGKAKMSACWNSTLVSPARSAFRSGFGDRLCRDIDRREVAHRASLGQGDRLGADAAPSLEYPAPAR